MLCVMVGVRVPDKTLASSEQFQRSSTSRAPSIAPSGAVEVRLVMPADYACLARFLSSFGDETRAQDFWVRRFNLWWDANPAFQEGVPRGWVLCVDNTIKGFLGNVPSQVQLFGRTVTAFGVTTWRVLPAYRSHSLRLLHQALRCAKGSISFDTTPSDDVVRILKSLKFQLLPHFENLKRSVIILNPRRFLASKLHGKMLADVGGWLAEPVLRAFQDWRLGVRRKCDGIEARHLTRADSSFDELWTRTRHLYANTNVRSAAAVNWYCFTDENFRKHLFGCFSAERLVGYLIATSRIRDGLKVLACLDVWLDPDAHLALSVLLAATRHRAQEDDFDLLEIPHYNDSLARRFKALCLFQRSAVGDRSAYYKIEEVAALDQAGSYFVGMQGDRGL